jgi:hypothetical protein
MREFLVGLHPEFDPRYTSLLLAGLRRCGKVVLRKTDAVGGHAMVRVESGGRKFLVDLWDHSNGWDEPGLAWCDVYLKRSLAAAREKVVPFGMNYGGRGTLSALQAARVRGDLRKAVDLMRRPHWKDYENPPEGRFEDVVLLQTRLWDEEECPGDTGINEERVELVSALKAGLGDRFRGGLIDNALARKMAPQLIANGPTKQRDYVRWQMSAKVAVYTRGLFGSVGFKMAEYLASSKCIVSEPISCVFPTPLVDGKHLTVFRDTKECIELCRAALMAGRDRQRDAWSYYSEHVRLAADAMKVLAG